MLELPGIAEAYIDQAADRVVVVPASEPFDPRPVIEALKARGYTVEGPLP